MPPHCPTLPPGPPAVAPSTLDKRTYVLQSDLTELWLDDVAPATLLVRAGQFSQSFVSDDSNVPSEQPQRPPGSATRPLGHAALPASTTAV